jgi:hypothetical protein
VVEGSTANEGWHYWYDSSTDVPASWNDTVTWSPPIWTWEHYIKYLDLLHKLDKLISRFSNDLEEIKSILEELVGEEVEHK